MPATASVSGDPRPARGADPPPSPPVRGRSRRDSFFDLGAVYSESSKVSMIAFLPAGGWQPSAVTPWHS